MKKNKYFLIFLFFLSFIFFLPKNCFAESNIVIQRLYQNAYDFIDIPSHNQYDIMVICQQSWFGGYANSYGGGNMGLDGVSMTMIKEQIADTSNGTNKFMTVWYSINPKNGLNLVNHASDNFGYKTVFFCSAVYNINADNPFANNYNNSDGYTSYVSTTTDNFLINFIANGQGNGGTFDTLTSDFTLAPRDYTFYDKVVDMTYSYKDTYVGTMITNYLPADSTLPDKGFFLELRNSEIIPTVNPISNLNPFNFNLGIINCCQLQDCILPFTYSIQAHGGTVEVYDKQNCNYGDSNELASTTIDYLLGQEQNDLIIPASKMNISTSTNNICYAGRFWGNNIITGNPEWLTFSSSGHDINIYATSSDYCNIEIWSGIPEYSGLCDGLSTSTISGNIECAFRHLGQFLLMPDEKSFTDFNKTYEKIKTKFPFSAFFDLNNIIKNAIGTTTQETGTFDIPMINNSGQIYMLPVLSSSSLANAIGQTNANIFRQTIIYFFWILIAIIIFFTLRKL